MQLMKYDSFYSRKILRIPSRYWRDVVSLIVTNCTQISLNRELVRIDCCIVLVQVSQMCEIYERKQ